MWLTTCRTNYLLNGEHIVMNNAQSAVRQALFVYIESAQDTERHEMENNQILIFAMSDISTLRDVQQMNTNRCSVIAAFQCRIHYIITFFKHRAFTYNYLSDVTSRYRI